MIAAPGTEILIYGDIKGYIESVNIGYKGAMKYECSYMHNGIRYSKWFEEYEIEIKPSNIKEYFKFKIKSIKEKD